jgi:hydroxyacylglutathione hydrolase
LIIKRIVVGMYGTNCYVAGSETTAVGMIVDPGAEASRIMKTVQEMKLNITLIILTHGHPDHTGALEEVRKKTGAQVSIHEKDAIDLPSRTPAGLLLKGGEKIEVGDLKFLVLHTPGHSPGGICLYTKGVLFCGDTLFNGSVGRTDFPGGSMKQLLDGIFTKLLVLPDDTIIYPGHESGSTIGDERKYNPFLQGDVT